jgi:hypothetical protein
MRPKRKDLLRQSTLTVGARHETNTPRRSGRLPGDNNLDPRTPTDSGHEADVEEHARRRGRAWFRGGSSAERTRRRLGPLEYALLALIALGIGITIAMAILNPSA